MTEQEHELMRFARRLTKHMRTATAETKVAMVTDIDDTIKPRTLAYIGGDDTRDISHYKCVGDLHMRVFERYMVPLVAVSAFPQTFVTHSKRVSVRRILDEDGIHLADEDVFVVGGVLRHSLEAITSAIGKLLGIGSLVNYDKTSKDKLKSLGLYRNTLNVTLAQFNSDAFVIFFGDNGQGDVEAGVSALTHGFIDLCLIHKVSAKANIVHAGLYYFDDYTHAIKILQELVRNDEAPQSLGAVLAQSCVPIISRHGRMWS
jgi:hypothetical protein